jgi:hypothetical protein
MTYPTKPLHSTPLRNGPLLSGWWHSAYRGRVYHWFELNDSQVVGRLAGSDLPASLRLVRLHEPAPICGATVNSTWLYGRSYYAWHSNCRSCSTILNRQANPRRRRARRTRTRA